ncbi:MAG: alanine racemase [Bacilli bacterium]|nr:alanine racemase [Bacilli bacterium]
MDDFLYMEVDLKKFASNLKNIIKLTGKNLIPVIKSNAYGCGDLEIAAIIESLGVKLVAVVDIDEALRLCKKDFNFDILIMNSLHETKFKYLDLYSNLVISINSLKDADSIARYQLKRKLKVHIQIDTGMSRLGLKTEAEYLEALKVLKIKEIVLEGIYTHFTDSANYSEQLDNFLPYLKHYPYEIVHTSGSYTYLLTDFGTHNRIGVNLYAQENGDLHQIVKIACYPLAINKLKKGETVGYDRHYQAKEDELIAVLPIGYYNGYRRSLSGFPVLANNKRFYSVGKICMNHIFVRVDESVTLDTEFIITSGDLPVGLMAEYLSTVPHEILCMFRIGKIRYLK